MAPYTPRLQFLRDNTYHNDRHTGKPGDITIDEQRKRLRLHDGAKLGGMEIPNIQDLGKRLLKASVVDNLTSNSSADPLSAKQGKILKGFIDNINDILTSDDVNLDELQEVVDFIKANRDDLNSLGITNIAGLTAALNSKVDKVAGKALSDNNFSDAEVSKLSGIEAGAEVNRPVTASRSSSSTTTVLNAKGMNDHTNSGDHDDRYYTKGQVNGLVSAADRSTNLSMGGSGNNRVIVSSTGNNTAVPIASTSNAGFMSTGDKSKLNAIEAGAQRNVGDEFDENGNYAGLRARATTKADVGLPNVNDVALNWDWGDDPLTHVWGSSGDATESYVYNANDVAEFLGLGTAAYKGWTSSRNSGSTDLLLSAKGMDDHTNSGDHDGRYYTKAQLNNRILDDYDSNTRGFVGQAFFVNQDNTSNAFEPSYTTVLDPGVVQNNEEYNDLKAAIGDFSKIFHQWYRFSHSSNDGVQPSPIPQGTSLDDVWSYDPDTNKITSNLNTSRYLGFVSPDKHEDYTLEVEVSSVEQGDDDYIGVVAAFATDANGYEQRLEVFRTQGGFIEGSATGALAWLYSSSGATRKVIYKTDDTTPLKVFKSPNGWAEYGKTYNAVIEIIRSGDNFDVKVSDVSDSGTTEETFSFNLNDHPELSVFKGPQSYGYVCFSQKDSAWKVNIAPAPIQTIHILDTKEFKKWDGVRWVNDTTSTVENTFDTGKFYYNDVTKRLYYNFYNMGLRQVQDKTSIDPESYTLVKRDGTGKIIGHDTDLSITGAGNNRTIVSSTGNNLDVPTATALSAGFMSTGDKTKLNGIETGAEKNVGDTFNANGNYGGLRARSTTKADVGLPNVNDVALNWSYGTEPLTHVWGSSGDSTESYVYRASDLSDFLGLGSAAVRGYTSSRTSSSTGLLLAAKGMNDHRTSGDHDGRYYTKSQVDSLFNGSGKIINGSYGSPINLFEGVSATRWTDVPWVDLVVLDVDPGGSAPIVAYGAQGSVAASERSTSNRDTSVEVRLYYRVLVNDVYWGDVVLLLVGVDKTRISEGYHTERVKIDRKYASVQTTLHSWTGTRQVKLQAQAWSNSTLTGSNFASCEDAFLTVFY